MTNLFVRSGISFVDRSEVLTHIGNEMLAKGVVYDTWPQALIAREAEFPTGIMLEQHAIAIPHCEAIHAKSSAIYLLRPTNKVHFQQADDDNDVEVSLVIAFDCGKSAAAIETFTLFIWQVTTARYRRDTNHSS